jgi:hypothetical protein
MRIDDHRRAVGTAALALTIAAPVLSIIGLAYVLTLIAVTDSPVYLEELPVLTLIQALSLFALIAGAVLAVVAVSRGGTGRKRGIAALWIFGVVVIIAGAAVTWGVISGWGLN